MKNNDLMKIIEGLLFIAGSNGITIGELITIVNVDQMTIENSIINLRERYYQNNNSFTIIETAQTYKLTTTNEHNEYYQKYAEIEFNDKLSQSALETLAIIAYNQPITRFDIEEKRGVMAGHNLKTLQTRELIKVIGKSKEVGRPNLYGTTTEFLDYLGLNSLEELPKLSEFKLNITEDDADLFDDVEDFKEIKKRLLTSDNIVQVQPDVEIEDINQIVIPELKLHFDEEENDAN